MITLERDIQNFMMNMKWFVCGEEASSFSLYDIHT